MRISSEEAAFVAAYRYIAVKELALYHTECSLSEVLFRTVKLSIKNNKSYMNNVRAVKPLVDSKCQKYAGGELEVPAYLAQSSLDAIIQEGFTPCSDKEYRVVSGLFLTRPDVKEVSDIYEFMAPHWADEVKDKIEQIARKVV